MRKKLYHPPTVTDFANLEVEHQERLRGVRDLLIAEPRRWPIDDDELDRLRKLNWNIVWRDAAFKLRICLYGLLVIYCLIRREGL